MSNADERRHVREATFWSKVEVLGANQCWEWRGPRDHGYGITNGWAHRKAWEFWNGAISEEFSRGSRRRRCRKRGHPFDEQNTMLVPGGRNCRQCVRDYSREWHRKDREKKRANA